MLKTQIDNIKDVIFTNNSIYKNNINFLYNDIIQKEFLEEISETINEKLLFITNNNNWVICFNNFSNKSSIDQFNFLKEYKKVDLDINNINYSVYTNNILKIKDNDIIYEEGNPIFTLKDDVNTYISNNFDELQNIQEKTSLFDQYLNNKNETRSYNYIVNEKIFIKDINYKQMVKYYKSLQNLQYLINTELFSLEDTDINISHIIPERNEMFYLESNIKIF